MPKTPWPAVCQTFIRVRLQWCKDRNNTRIKLWGWVGFFPSMRSPGHTTWLNNHRARFTKCEGRKLRKTKLISSLCFWKMQQCALKTSTNLMNRCISVSSHYTKQQAWIIFFFFTTGVKKACLKWGGKTKKFRINWCSIIYSKYEQEKWAMLP